MSQGKIGTCDQREEWVWEVEIATAVACWVFNTYSRAWPQTCKHIVGAFFLLMRGRGGE